MENGKCPAPATCRLPPATCRLRPASRRLPPATYRFVTETASPVSERAVVDFKRKVEKQMRSWSTLGIVVLVLAAVGLSAVEDARAQNSTAASSNASTQSRASLIQTTREYKTGSENLLLLQEAELAKAAAKLEQLRRLVAEGLVAKNELQESEQALTTIRNKIESTRRQIADSDNTIAEIVAAEELAKTQSVVQATRALTKSRSYLTPTVLRYNGPTYWSLAGLAEIQGFFSSKFGRSLPTSAVGQSGTHDQLGLDHRNAVDVALHPDSVEGKALISYLQSQGIPFLAFRAAIPGVATGPHIHIGAPSHRFI